MRSVSAPVPPPEPAFWATWGVGEWSLAVAVLAAILAVLVPYAIRHHQQHDARRAEERKERLASLRTILADVDSVQDKLKAFSYKVLDYNAAEVKELRDWTEILLKKCSDPRLVPTDRSQLTQNVTLLHAEASMLDGIPSAASFRNALRSLKHSDGSDDLYTIIVEMIERATFQRDSVRKIHERSGQLRQQVVSLIENAK
jgi:hypothetical protein